MNVDPLPASLHEELEGLVAAFVTACRASDALVPRPSAHPAGVTEALEALTDKILDAGAAYPIKCDDAWIRDRSFYADSPLFLTGVHKSGTTLLQNLCDGHSALLVYPVDGGLGFENASRGARFLIGTLVRRTLLPRLPSSARRRWVLGREEGDLEPYVLLARFFFGLVPPGEATAKDIFRTLAMAFCAIQPAERQEKVKCWAYKSTLTVHGADPLAEMFPSARFIQIVRHPCAVYAAQRRKQGQKGRLFTPYGELLSIYSGLDQGLRRVEHLGNRKYLMVRYEDLVVKTDSVMKGVAEYLDVSFEDILTRPTLYGRDATANTAYRGQHEVSGRVSSETVERWREELSPAEVNLVGSFMAGFLDGFGYSGGRPARGLFRAAMQVRREYRTRTDFKPLSMRDVIAMWVRRVLDAGRIRRCFLGWAGSGRCFNES
jgi:hypothetical protein